MEDEMETMSKEDMWEMLEGEMNDEQCTPVPLVGVMDSLEYTNLCKMSVDSAGVLLSHCFYWVWQSYYRAWWSLVWMKKRRNRVQPNDKRFEKFPTTVEMYRKLHTSDSIYSARGMLNYDRSCRIKSYVK